jgi:peptidoglycan/LPS O-acetylase OafA/YrhL
VVAPEPSIRGHMPALDGVRGLAVVMVLVLHFVGGPEPVGALETGIGLFAKYGSYGVELFFVLSGFLITGILLDARDKGGYFRNFYMRRLLRIFPLYYAVLVVLFGLVPLVPTLQGPVLDFLRERQLWAWLYGVNIYVGMHGEWALPYIDHFWSLSVEEHFYLVWPLVVWWLGPRPRRLLVASLALSLGAMLARLVGSIAGLSTWTTYVLTPFRLDGLAFGAFLAVLVRQPGGLDAIRKHLPRLSAVAGTLLAVTYVWTLAVSRESMRVVLPIRASLILLLLAALLLWTVLAPADSRLSRLFRNRSLGFMGTYSYGIYVYHHFVSYYLVTHGTDLVLTRIVGWHFGAVLLQSAFGVALSTVVAYGSYHLLEKRFLTLKRFFETAR